MPTQGWQRDEMSLESRQYHASPLRLRCFCMTEVLQSLIAVACCDVPSQTLLAPGSVLSVVGGANRQLRLHAGILLDHCLEGETQNIGA